MRFRFFNRLFINNKNKIKNDMFECDVCLAWDM